MNSNIPIQRASGENSDNRAITPASQSPATEKFNQEMPRLTPDMAEAIVRHKALCREAKMVTDPHQPRMPEYSPYIEPPYYQEIQPQQDSQDTTPEETYGLAA
jgi:hypothetical protein